MNFDNRFESRRNNTQPNSTEPSRRIRTEPSTLIRPEARQKWLESRASSEQPPVPHFANNTQRRTTGILPNSSTQEEQHNNNGANAHRKEMNMNNTKIDSKTPAADSQNKEVATDVEQQSTPCEKKKRSFIWHFAKYTVPPIIIALIIVIAAEMIPGFKEKYDVLYHCADFYVSLCESLLKLGLNSINMIIHFFAQLFGHEDPTALDSFLKSFVDIGEVFKSIWLYIRAF